VCGCVHKLNLDDPGHDPAVHKLLQINLPDFGSVFTNAWLLTKQSYSHGNFRLFESYTNYFLQNILLLQRIFIMFPYI